MLINGLSRILFLGDSITQDGQYIRYLGKSLLEKRPQSRINLINLGKSAETVAGLTEPGRSLPRPCVFERAETAIEASWPQAVFFMYGMNDAIYHPFSEERLEAYQKGVKKLIGIIKSCGCKAVAMTPTPFDEPSCAAAGLKMASEEAQKFNKDAIFERYGGVIEKYAEWVLTLGNEVDLIIDLHIAVSAFLSEKRRTEPGYLMGDGIHPNDEAHAVMAAAIEKAILRQ